MACVVYTCRECGDFWRHKKDNCPECNSDNILEEFDEENDHDR